MRIEELLWDDQNAEHIARHHIVREEIEELCYGRHWTLRARGENAFAIYGQTFAGRYLMAVLGHRGAGTYYVVTARPMSDTERRRYRDWKGV